MEPAPNNQKTWVKRYCAFQWLSPLLLLVLFSLPFRVQAQTVTGTYNGMLYSASNGQVTITGYTSSLSGSISVPATINFSGSNLPVTCIGGYAFYYCSGLTKITIPNNVTSIGSYAFSN